MTIAVIGIITVVVIFNHQGFSDSVELNGAAQELSQTIREAQIKGLAVEHTNDEFKAGRGVYIAEGDDHFIYFADLSNGGNNNPNQFDPGVGEKIRQIKLPPGFEVEDLKCGDSSCSGGELHIVYSRPRPQAHFQDGNGEVSSDQVSITILSPRGRRKEVQVYRTGQVSVVDSE